MFIDFETGICCCFSHTISHFGIFGSASTSTFFLIFYFLFDILQVKQTEQSLKIREEQTLTYNSCLVCVLKPG